MKILLQWLLVYCLPYLFCVSFAAPVTYQWIVANQAAGEMTTIPIACVFAYSYLAYTVCLSLIVLITRLHYGTPMVDNYDSDNVNRLLIHSLLVFLGMLPYTLVPLFITVSLQNAMFDFNNIVYVMAVIFTYIVAAAIVMEIVMASSVFNTNLRLLIVAILLLSFVAINLLVYGYHYSHVPTIISGYVFLIFDVVFIVSAVVYAITLKRES